MVLRFVFVLLFLNCARTADDSYEFALFKDNFGDLRDGFWPMNLNAFKVMEIRKRDTQGQSEGGVVVSPQKEDTPAPAATPAVAPSTVPAASPAATPAVKPAPVDAPTNQTGNKPDVPKSPSNATAVNTAKATDAVKPVVQTEDRKLNFTASTETPNTLALGTPGVVKRAIIVFGGFGLLAVAYIIFKRKSNKNDTSNNHDDSNQFRYGVLRSDEQRDNMEFSRVPLTMDSDEDDDEDLEIFDLEQKKKSLSYVNLQPDDEEFVIDLPNESEGNRPQDNDRNNLLLDIEDRPNDTLINWSNK